MKNEVATSLTKTSKMMPVLLMILHSKCNYDHYDVADLVVNYGISNTVVLEIP